MPRWTEADLRAYMERTTQVVHPVVPAAKDVTVSPSMDVRKSKAEEGLNKLEAAYLAKLRADDQHTHLGIQAVTLRLADNTRYTPDFSSIDWSDPAGRMVFHEVKGFMRDDARVKLKVAASQFPMFDFLLCYRKPKKEGGQWVVTRVQP